MTLSAIPFSVLVEFLVELDAGLAVARLDAAGHGVADEQDVVLAGQFGALDGFERFAGGDLKPELAAGYAAPEQYRSMEVVTDATDVYGLAATLFYTVTGNVPPVGNKRVKNSDDLFMSAEVAEELSQPVCSTLFNALLVSPDQRTATVEDFREQLGLEPNVSALRNEARQERESFSLSSFKTTYEFPCFRR